MQEDDQQREQTSGKLLARLTMSPEGRHDDDDVTQQQREARQHSRQTRDRLFLASWFQTTPRKGGRGQSA